MSFNSSYLERFDDELPDNPKPKPKRKKPTGPQPELAKPENQTEIENARRFVAEYGHLVGYVFPWKKFVAFTGKRWEIDSAGHAKRLAKKTAGKIVLEAIDTSNPSAIKFGLSTASSRGINAMLELAKPDIAVDYRNFDKNPFLLNCENGTLDLKTGKLRPHDRDDMLTKIVPWNYNPDAETYEWDKFVESLFSTQNEVDYLRRFFGYCLTGDVSEHCLSIPWGGGANGKSTLLEAFLATLGPSYSMAAPAEMLMVSKSDRHPTEKADLFGMRFVVTSETESGRRLAESTVKQLTGGDTIRARRMKEDFWEFQPTHKIALCTNHRPEVKGDDEGIWRRLRLIPFVNRFWDESKGETGPPELKADKQLPERLKTMGESILVWAVQGCLEWQRDELGTSEAIRSATAQYRNDSDVVGQFIADRCVSLGNNRSKFSVLWQSFQSWIEESGEDGISKKKFSTCLQEKGYEKVHSNGIHFIGIVLKE